MRRGLRRRGDDVAILEWNRQGREECVRNRGALISPEVLRADRMQDRGSGSYYSDKDI